MQGINGSLDLIRRTRGGKWPSGPVTEEFNYVDLVWYEVEFRDETSFTYAVYDAGGQYVACCYLYPMGRRTPLDESLVEHDVDVSWWVTPDAYDRGYYVKLHPALQHWVAEEFGWRNRTSRTARSRRIEGLPGISRKNLRRRCRELDVGSVPV